MTLKLIYLVGCSETSPKKERTDQNYCFSKTTANILWTNFNQIVTCNRETERGHVFNVTERTK